MNDESLKIILIEDNPADVRFIKELLKEDKNIKITDVNLLSKAIKLLEKEEYSLILLDLNLPDSKGINTFKEFSSKTKNIPIVILTVVDNKELAIEAIKLGAQDYKIKGSFDYISLKNSINYAIERKKLLTESKISSIIFNNLIIGMAIVTPEHEILDANYAFCKIIGYSIDELKKLTFKDFTHPEDLDESVKYVKELASGKINNFILEKRYIRKDGNIIFGRVKISSVKDNYGKIIYNVVSIEDITEHKKFQNYLVESEKRNKMIVENMNDAFYIHDFKGKILDVNDNASKMLGYSKEELMKMSLKDIDSEKNAKLIKKRMDELIKKNGLAFESEHVKKDGTIVPVLISTKIIKDSLVESFVKDNSEKYNQEKSLKESEEKYKNFIEGTDSLVQSMSPEGKIIYVNPSWIKKLGYNANDIKNMNLMDILSPECIDNCMKLFKQVLSGKHVHNIEAVFLKKDKTRVYVLGSAFPRIIDGKVVATQGIFKDITNEKKANEAILKSHEEMLALFDSIDDVIYVTDLDTYEILYVNKYAKKIFGKELIRGLCYKEFQGFNKPCSFCTNKKIKALKGKSYRWQYHNPKIDKYYDLIDKMINWPDGRKVRFELARDITELKKFEEKLKESEEKYKTIVENQPYIAFMLDKTGNIVYANKTCEEVTGFKLKDFKGKNLISLGILDKKDYAKAVIELGKNLMGKTTSKSIYKLNLKNNTTRYVELIGIPIKEGNKVTKILDIGRDITDELKAREELTSSQKMLESTISSMQDLVFVFDTDARFTYCHTPQNSILYADPKFFIGKKISEVMPKENVKLFNKAFNENKKGINSNYEYSLEIKGKKLHFYAKLSPLIIDKKFLGSVAVIRDVTEKYNQQKSLIESEERFKLLFEKAPDSYYLMDTKGVIIDGNKAAEELVGYTKKELIGKNVFNLNIFSLSNLKESTNMYKDVLFKGKSGPNEFEIKRKDGKLINIEVITSLVEISGKKIILGLIRNVTEKNKYVRLLHENEEKYRNLVENINDVIFSMNNEGIINYISSNVKNFGFDSSKIIGKNFHELIHPKDAKRIVQELNLTLTTGKEFPTAFRIINPKGKIYWIEEFGKVIRDKSGKIMGTQGILRDITERKAVEEKLKQSDNIVSHALDMLCIAGFDGYFKVLNPSWSKVLGYSTEELLSKPWIEFVHPDDIEKTKNVKITLVNGQKIYQFENRYVCKDGSIKWLSWNSFPNPEEKIMYGVARDITEQKIMQNELIESKKRFEEVSKQSNEVIWEIDKNGFYTYLSEACIDVYGYEPEELIGKKRFYDLSPENYKKNVTETYLNYTKLRKKIKDFINPILAKNKKIVWVVSNGIPIFQEDEFKGYRGIDSDITDKKLIDDEIKLNEKRLKFIIDIFQYKYKNLQDFLDYALNKVLELTESKIGYIYHYEEKTKKFILNTWSKDVMKECKIQNPQTCYDLSKTGIWGEAVRQRKEIIINDFLAKNPFKKGYPKGHTPLYKYMTFPVFKEKEIIGVVGLANKANDYTETDLLQAKLLMQSVYREVEKRKGEERIVKLKNDYESIFESSNDSLIIFNKNGIILKINNAFEKIFNTKKNKFINKNINSIKLIDLNENKINFNNINNFKINEYFELKYNGYVMSANLSIVNSEFSDNIFQLSLRDITQEKEIEKVKEFNEKILLKKMEEENMIKLKNQLLMRVSHELRHPLVPIVGYASVMLEENPSDIQEKYLQKILQNSNYLKDLINKVLEVINFETGEARINPTEFNLNKLIEKIIFENETKADLKGLKIKKDFKKIGKVMLDEQKLSLAVTNILDNAIKFTDSGKITITLDKNENQIIIGINDTGKGMTNEQIERIFIYSQSEKYDNLNMGLGLGLILSKYIIKAHNGELIISSVLNKGTRVKIILPKVIN